MLPGLGNYCTLNCTSIPLKSSTSCIHTSSICKRHIYMYICTISVKLGLVLHNGAAYNQISLYFLECRSIREGSLNGGTHVRTGRNDFIGQISVIQVFQCMSSKHCVSLSAVYTHTRVHTHTHTHTHTHRRIKAKVIKDQQTTPTGHTSSPTQAR